MLSEARAPDKESIKADYLKGIKPKELSEKYDISINTIKSWIKRYGWSKDTKSEGAPRKGKGAPLNNVNAVGYGAPEKNKNAEKFGFFSKYLPEETKEIFDAISDANPLDLVWHQIQLAYTAIVRAQRIMDVTDKDEMIKELKKSKIKTSNRNTAKTKSESSEEEYEYEFQFAWDRQATFMNAQARAQSELRSLIKQYDELLHKNWGLATEEQKARIAKLKAEVTENENSNEQVQDWKTAIIEIAKRRSESQDGGIN